MTLLCTYPLLNSAQVFRQIEQTIQAVAPDSVIKLSNRFSGQWTTTVDGLGDFEEVDFKLRLIDQCSSIEKV